MSLLSVNICFELAAFIISAVAYPRLKGTPLRLFTPFLLFITLVEITGRYLKMVYHQNCWLYNITTAIEFLFYAHIFESQLQAPAFKKGVRRFMMLFPLLVLLNLFFGQGFMDFNSRTQSVGSIFMAVFCGLYFYDLLRHPQQGELFRDPMFWITTGILFFNLGDLSYNLLFTLLQKYATNSSGKLFQDINNNLILMLYSCFIIAFLCRKNPRKSLSP